MKKPQPHAHEYRRKASWKDVAGLTWIEEFCKTCHKHRRVRTGGHGRSTW